jgi:uncharacterized membrane protein
MFEFLFKYPLSLFQKGQFVLLGPGPVWVLGLAVLAAAGLLFWHVRRNHGLLSGVKPVGIWALQTALVALILFLLWHPALSVATLRQQQNIVAVMVDDSRSMAIADQGAPRIQQAEKALTSGLLNDLSKRFQVRLYRFDRGAQRVPKPDGLTANAPASRIGDSLKEVMADSASLPLGAIVLLSDGADNSGGVDLETMQQIRRQRIPVHTIGFGREKAGHDVEIEDVELPHRALADSRLQAQVTIHQNGYEGRKARLTVRDGSNILASREITFKTDNGTQTEMLAFAAGAAGPKTLTVGVDALPDEENKANNAVLRLVAVESAKPRILYIEGEPRWEYKFIRRAAEEDKNLQLVSMLRTTQNKIYRQGIDNPHELEDGFPAKAEELFAYQGLMIGSVEFNYFTAAQQDLIREFVNRRGGGLLFLGGRYALSEGGWPSSSLAELAPVRLPQTKGTFHRDQARAELTPAGRESLVTRLDENPERNQDIWNKLPALANYQDVSEPRPGAVVLLNTIAGSHRMPLLAMQNYGRGRSALFATAGSWRWKMLRDHDDKMHYTFWQQLMRWMVSGTPGPVSGTTPKQVLSDDSNLQLRAEVRDKSFQPVFNAKVEARIVGPDGQTHVVNMNPQSLEDGVYTAQWTAEQPGSYVAEIVAGRDQQDLGRDVVLFRREDGVAENFHTAQNRELLRKLASETGGRYYTADNAARLGEEISYSEAGITTRETRDLWDMPIVFFLALLIRGSEWLLRRKWGVV